MSVSVVGFDIGSLSSFVAVARGGGIETVTNEYSDRLTPTCVSFSGNMRLIGTAAKLQHVTNIKNTFVNFVQLLGKKVSDHAVAKELQYLPYSIDEAPDGRISIPAMVCGEKHNLLPEQLLAMQMTKLKEIAENAISSKIVDVVINVPAYYTDTERRAVMDASRISGLNCVKLVNDITAVGTAYGLYNTNLPPQDQPPKNVAFVSVGYTGTQVAICSFNSGKMKVLATACDAFLGGRDFDRVIFDQVSKEFCEKYKLNITESPKATVRLLQECEKLKKLMSANSMELPINVECLMNDRDFSSRMKRSDFELLASSHLKRFEEILVQCLTLSKLAPGDVHSVELVGGSSRIPSLKNIVASVFGQEGCTTLNADEAVARGCALQAAICSPAFKVRDFSVTEACPYSVLLQWDKNESSEQNVVEAAETDETVSVTNRDTSVEIFPFLHPIPSSRQICFSRRGPFSLEARYANAKTLFCENVVIGVFHISNIPQKSGESCKIRIKARMNTHGIFTISQAQLAEEYEKEVEVDAPDEATVGADDKVSESKSMEVDTPSNGDTASSTPGPDGQVPNEVNTKVQKKKIIKKKKCTRYHDLPIDASIMQFTTKQLNDFCEYEASLIQQDKLERERTHAKNAVEEYVYDMRSKIQGAFNSFASSEDQQKLLKALDDAEDWLYGDGEDMGRQIYVDRLNDLRCLGNPIEFRASEHVNRPAAIESFGRSVVHIRKVLDSIYAGEPTYDHLTPEQINDLQNHVNEHSNWLNQQLNQQNSRPQTADPILKVSDIVAQQHVMESACHPIINTPKPVPPPAPQSNDAENNTKTENCNNGSDAKTATSNGTPKKSQTTEKRKTENMDLD